jgi:hypothetical protein
MLLGRGRRVRRCERRPQSPSQDERSSEEIMGNGRANAAKVTCEDCYFHHQLLCALSSTEPCVSFRPNRPEGLRPPRQMHFVFRQERRLQVAWAFPSAQEQVALHT